MARPQKKTIKLPSDIKHGCAWWSKEGYVRWQVMIDGRTKASAVKSKEKAFASMRAAIVALQKPSESIADGLLGAATEDSAFSAVRSPKKWCEHVLDSQELSPHLEETTRDLYRCVLSRWVYQFNDWIPVTRVDRPFIATLRGKLLAALFDETVAFGLTAYQNVCTALTLCLRKAAEHGLLPDDLAIHLRLKKEERKKLSLRPSADRGRRRYLTNEQWVKLVEAFKGHWLYTPLIVGSYTGMRTAEIAGLTWEHVHLDAKRPYLQVTQQAKRIKGKGVIAKTPKYSSYRTYPLLPPVVEALNDLPRSSGYVFQNSRSNVLDVGVVAQLLKKKAQDLGITCQDGSPPVFTDLARRSASTERARAGISLEAGARLAGHQDSRTQLIYEQEWRNQEEIIEDDYKVMLSIYAARTSAMRQKTSPIP